LAKTPRGWTGARTPSAIKRVRQAERRRAIIQPRQSAAKTRVAYAIKVGEGTEQGDPAVALAEAMSALDRAAKSGAIHRNAAARRKSRLALKLNALAGGEAVAASHVSRTTGSASAAKAARTRIATAKATKAKGPQTAAGKARAALSKTARAEAATAEAAARTAKAGPARTTTAAKAAPKAPAKVPAKAPAKVPAKASAKVPAKAPAKTATKGDKAKPAPKAGKAKS
jgi:ribosomal protein S20